MGTNYYWIDKTEVKDTCKECGHDTIREGKRVHIGKSSIGWTFAVHIYPERGIKTLDGWVEIWYTQPGVIVDEYGEVLTRIDMLSIIIARAAEAENPNLNAAWLPETHAIPGPNGLARRTLGRGGVTGHGSGTWDYLDCEFS